MTAEDILNTRIVIVPDDGAWFVQGVDVDYFASGSTRMEALSNFIDGLRVLVTTHEARGSLESIRIPSSLAMKKIIEGLSDLD